MKLSQYFFALLVATSLFSCKKDNSNKDCSLSEANLVGTYKISAVTYKESASSPVVDAMSLVDSCSRDDIQTYKSDHTYIYIDAGLKCDPPGDGTGTWSLSGNAFTAEGTTGTITAFDCSGFTVTQSNFITTGDSFMVTFKRQ